MQISQCQTERIRRILGSIGLGLLFALVFSDVEKDGLSQHFYLAWLLDAGIAYILWEGNFQIYKYLDKKIAWDAFKKRIVIQSILSLLLTGLVIFGLIPLMVTYGLEKPSPSFGSLLPTFVMSVLVTVMITALNAGNAFLLSWKESVKAQEELKRKFVEAQYKALRSQVNPHFLFNSFNTLNALILESEEKSRKYVGELSAFYRKVLNQPNSELVELQEEKHLLEHFTFLLHTRYEEDLEVVLEGDFDAQATKKIPHMSLQLCLENAVKHNKVSSRHPLKVVVRVSHNAVEVQNIVNAKQVLPSESSGLGLKQIKAVYDMAGITGFEYGIQENIFTTKLPLV